MDFQLNLDREKIEQAHPARPLVVEPGTTVRTALRLMAEQRTGALLVCQQKQLLGIFTERDAVRLMAAEANLDIPISGCMVPSPHTLTADATVGNAVEQMAEGGFRRIPIVDRDGVPTGLVKVSGILRFMVEHFPNVVYTLPPAPHHKTKDREGA